ncbi:MAG: hypothetical protein NZM65_05265 [Flavobacteriales bacterium]|nr:hypothetical protein [Flavobacteriales bacterium]MDW8410081.1 hypothetical protein [Flavobacteriales bacterium]
MRRLSRTLWLECGGTRTQGFFADEEGLISWEIDEAFNALTDKAEVLEKILNHYQVWLQEKKPERVWFFAAGYRKDSCQEVNRILEKKFHSSTLHIGNDLEALGIALGQSGLVGILGTGASAALWNGHQILDQGPSLGWIVGDEGSGAWLGRQVLRSFYYNLLPDELKPSFEEYLSQTSRAIVLQLIYGPQGRRFLAGLARWLSCDAVRKHWWSQALLQQGFQEYWEFQVQPLLSNQNTTQALFSGGIVWHFREEWEKFVKERGFHCQIASSARDYIIGFPHRLDAILKNQVS